jgi:mersacidin/lichenicidin family type 2 lantibiotic
MSTTEIVRAWKDPEFRLTVNEVPAHPAGRIEFSDPSLHDTTVNNNGGPGGTYTTVFGCHTHHCTVHCRP